MGLQIDMFGGGDALPPPSEDLDQFFTRPKVADAFARWAGLGYGMRVLEPSAGEGALLKSCPEADWTAVELCRARAQWIVKHGWASEVHHADFLKWAPEAYAAGVRWDLTHGNPPYSGGLDTSFVESWIENRLSVRSTWLLPTNFLHSQTRDERIWRWVKLSRMCCLVTRPQFSVVDGKNDGPKRDYSFFELWRRRRRRQHGGADHPKVTWLDIST